MIRFDLILFETFHLYLHGCRSGVSGDRARVGEVRLRAEVRRQRSDVVGLSVVAGGQSVQQP